MLLIPIQTPLDGYARVDLELTGTDIGTGGSVTVCTIGAPDGKQFLSGAGEFVVVDSSGDVIDVLPVSVVLSDSLGNNCRTLTVTGIAPDDIRSYRLKATGIVANQPINAPVHK